MIRVGADTYGDIRDYSADSEAPGRGGQSPFSSCGHRVQVQVQRYLPSQMQPLKASVGPDLRPLVTVAKLFWPVRSRTPA